MNDKCITSRIIQLLLNALVGHMKARDLPAVEHLASGIFAGLSGICSWDTSALGRVFYSDHGKEGLPTRFAGGN